MAFGTLNLILSTVLSITHNISIHPKKEFTLEKAIVSELNWKME